jgi:hypothetical protein
MVFILDEFLLNLNIQVYRFMQHSNRAHLDRRLRPSSAMAEANTSDETPLPSVDGHVDGLQAWWVSWVPLLAFSSPVFLKVPDRMKNHLILRYLAPILYTLCVVLHLGRVGLVRPDRPTSSHYLGTTYFNDTKGTPLNGDLCYSEGDVVWLMETIFTITFWE